MKRIAFLDEMRGSLILLVVLYHLLFDISLFFPAAREGLWLLAPGYEWLRAVVPGLFIALCGISCHLSHNNLRRGLLTAALALGITAVSLLILPESPIRYGILHLLATCILLYLPLSRLLRRVPAVPGILICLLIFCFTLRLQYGMIGISSVLPASLWNRDFLFFLGFPHDSMLSADYFPLMPWGFLFAAGAFGGRALAEGRAPRFFYRSHSTGMAVIGRHTLPVYLLHQPVWFGLLTLLRALR